MNKKLSIPTFLAPLLLATVIIILLGALTSSHLRLDNVRIIIIIVWYLLSVAMVIFIVKLRPNNIRYMPVSFIISLVPAFVYDIISPPSGFLSLPSWLVVLLIYVIPFFIISLVIIIFLSIRKKIKRSGD